MIARVIKIADLRLVRYVLASVGALAVDEAANRQRWKMQLRSQRQRERQSGGQ